MNQPTGVTASSPDATGVITPSPGVDTSGGNVAPDAIDQVSPEVSREPENIPYVRFKQEVEEKRALKSQVDQLAAQQRQALHVIQQLTTRTQQPQQQQTQDPEAELAKASFGKDADGEAAFEAVRRVIQYELKNAQKGLKDEISQNTQQMVQGLLGNVTGSIQTSQALDQMQRDGLLDDASKSQIASQMGQILQTNPEWQGHQPLLLDKVYMDMVRQGSIRPGSRQQPNPFDPAPRHMPMQPGGGVVTPRQPQQQNSAAIKQAEDAELNEIRNMFSRTFGDMSVEDMRKSVGVLPRSNRVVNTPTGEAVEEEILHGAYTFKKR